MCLSVISLLHMKLNANMAAMLEEPVLRCHYKEKSKSHQVLVFSIKQPVTTWGDVPGRKWSLRRELAKEWCFM